MNESTSVAGSMPYSNQLRVPNSETRVSVIDSHTGGEPTRVVIGGAPDLGLGSLVERRTIFREKFDAFRSAVVNEPRGSDVLVGALLCEPVDPSCCAGVIFFNNVGYLGMCGHGTIGLGVTLGRMGRISAGRHRLETPVGVIEFEYDGTNGVSLENVPSYRLRQAVTVEVPGFGAVTGDVAWGGNWFFLIKKHPFLLNLRNTEQLTDFAWKVRLELNTHGITGADGAEIDHVELFGPPGDPANHSRNFVLCPGKAFDRSPCGTGTSAKLACLHADGLLKPGEEWRQESILGSVFTGSVRVVNGQVIPRISGTAFITAEATLILDSADPFRTGIHS
ncbi:proline racemase family protein [Zavarzinella formosa]|uniref:proline racemase family protein n=1 Tax=Zavarzinella formosa TaxID=360055 RepID=UPI0003142BE4|nr:proline racemase family protein [Zavarzinella formosa]